MFDQRSRDEDLRDVRRAQVDARIVGGAVVSVSGSHPDSAVSVEPADSAAPVGAPGLSGVQAHPGHSGSGNDGSGDLSGVDPLEQVERLAALLEPEAFDADVPAREEWRESAKARARFHASRAIFSGYRLVSEDEATVERVARAIWVAAYPDTRGEVSAATERRWAKAKSETDLCCDRARAAVRALREGA